MLETTALTMSFGDRTLWRDLDLTLKPGSVTALVGASGAGKSTLLNCLGLLVAPTSGRIELDGRDLTALGRSGVRRFRRDQLGYLFQNYALIDDMTVRENLQVAIRARRGRGAAARATMLQALRQVGLDDQLDGRVSQLSGGEQQRVALARLMVKQPRLVLADEPTGALDQANTETVIGLLREMAGTGAMVVIATHDEWVRGVCDETVSVGQPSLVTAGDLPGRT
ncbi:ABC transporter ATP-binding protein [Kribbella sp. NPDC051620]|uniref:ABC transporter ATP-binding protein n=1 Tax=Kribbella sp. NPDC051620 TaxID=3364120 RepID=UPI0037B65B76